MKEAQEEIAPAKEELLEIKAKLKELSAKLIELSGASRGAVFEVIADKVRHNTRMVLEESRTKKILPREAAVNLAVQRVKKTMSYKRWSIF